MAIFRGPWRYSWGPGSPQDVIRPAVRCAPTRSIQFGWIGLICLFAPNAFAHAEGVRSGSPGFSCAAKPGANEQVNVQANAVDLKGLLGRANADLKSGAQTAGAIGALKYDWGFQLRSSDARFGDFVGFIGPMAELKTRCGQILQYEIEWGGGGHPSNLRNFHIRDSADDRAMFGRYYNEDVGRGSPKWTPVIAGYKYVARSSAGQYGWIGLWQTLASMPNTLVVWFPDTGTQLSNDKRYRILADLPLRLNLISALPGVHNDGAQIAVLSSAAPGEPTALAEFFWDGRN